MYRFCGYNLLARETPVQRMKKPPRAELRGRCVPAVFSGWVHAKITAHLGLGPSEVPMYPMYRFYLRTHMCACAHARMCRVSGIRRYIGYIYSYIFKYR